MKKYINKMNKGYAVLTDDYCVGYVNESDPCNQIKKPSTKEGFCLSNF
jgi:hypothetical protein